MTTTINTSAIISLAAPTLITVASKHSTMTTPIALSDTLTHIGPASSVSITDPSTTSIASKAFSSIKASLPATPTPSISGKMIFLPKAICRF